MISLTTLDDLNQLEYDKELGCIEDSYWLILEYLNGVRGPVLPAVSKKGDIFYFFDEGFLRISRREERIFLHGVKSEILKELEKRLGIN